MEACAQLSEAVFHSVTFQEVSDRACEVGIEPTLNPDYYFLLIINKPSQCLSGSRDTFKQKELPLLFLKVSS